MNAQEQREINGNGKRPGGVTGKGFRPGRSGNPAGRPKGQSLTGLLREQLDRDDNAQALVETIVRKAIEGDYQFCKLILDRTEGKVPDKVEDPEKARAQLVWGERQRRMLEDPEAMELACQLDALLARGYVPDVVGEIVSEGRATLVVDGKAYGGVTPLDI